MLRRGGLFILLEGLRLGDEESAYSDMATARAEILVVWTKCFWYYKCVWLTYPRRARIACALGRGTLDLAMCR